MFLKTRLMTPGPTPTAESTRLAMAAAQPHHRTSAFATKADRALDGLRWLWDTDDDALILSGSGTVGMEAALRSTLAPGDRVVVVTGGKFAERWRTIVKLIGCELVEVSLQWGEVAEPAEVAAAAEGAAALVMVASETSTGVLHPVADCAAAFRAASPEGLVLVDGITAVGCVDLSMKRDGLDVLVSGSQKAFGLPPGAAVVGVGARAWDKIEQTDARGYYLDLRRERKQTRTGQSAFTPPIPLVVGFDEVLTRWRAMGREALFQHAKMLSAGTLAGVNALGLEPFAAAPSPALTSVRMPDDVDVAALRKRMRTQYGCEVAGGQDHVKPFLLRIGHLGVVDPFDIVSAIGALELALADLGHATPGPPGQGAASALAAMAPFMSSATRLDHCNP